MFLLNGCTRPNPEHCAANGDCSNGFICDLSRNRCVLERDASDAGTDASSDATSVDATNGPRCNPLAAFATPTLVPNVNSALGIFSVSMTADELTAFFTASDNGSEYLLKMAARPTIDAEFPAPTAAPALATISSAQGVESFPSSAGSGLALYFHRSNPQTFTTAVVMSTRTTATARSPRARQSQWTALRCPMRRDR